MMSSVDDVQNDVKEVQDAYRAALGVCKGCVCVCVCACLVLRCSLQPALAFLIFCLTCFIDYGRILAVVFRRQKVHGTSQPESSQAPRRPRRH